MTSETAQKSPDRLYGGLGHDTDQWILSVATGLLGLIFIWAASWEK